MRAQGSSTVFDAKAPNQRKLISNVRKMVKLGMWPKGGPAEPLQTVNTLVTLRQKLRRDPANAKKLEDAHNMLMRFATQQIKRDQTIDESELAAFCFKAERDETTIEKYIEGLRKKTQNLIDGKVGNGLLDNDQSMKDAVRCFTKRLVAITTAKAKAPEAAPSATTV